jgi:hypothetical protein
MTWVGLLQHVLDDDERTRRAERLLSHVTTWLVVIGAVIVTAGVVLLNGPAWVSASGVGVGVVSAALAWLRSRRNISSAVSPTVPE